MTCALDIANNGFPVFLVEKEEKLGGLLRHVTSLEDGRRSSDIITPLVRNVRSHPRIHVFTGTQLVDLKGYVEILKAYWIRKAQKHDIKFGVAVIATGAKELVPEGYYNYGAKNVTTQLNIENALENGFEKVPENVG